MCFTNLLNPSFASLGKGVRAHFHPELQGKAGAPILVPVPAPAPCTGCWYQKERELQLAKRGSPTRCRLKATELTKNRKRKLQLSHSQNHTQNPYVHRS